MNTVKLLETDDQFQTELSQAGEKLVVIYYTAAWCAPCKKMKPVIEALSKKYPAVIFLKLDVDTCQETAINQGITVMPTFVLHKNGQKLDTLQGADPISLEEKIKQHIEKTEPEVSGHINLASFILKNHCECFNESDAHPLMHVFEDDDTALESDCDEQLIISIVFQQPVKIHSIKIMAPENRGPKDLKIFINQPNTLDFDSAESNVPIQELYLSTEQLNFSPIPLHYVKFQNVMNIQLFVKNNQLGLDKTVIKRLGFIGSTLFHTNMGDFKRGSGKMPPDVIPPVLTPVQDSALTFHEGENIIGTSEEAEAGS